MICSQQAQHKVVHHIYTNGNGTALTIKPVSKLLATNNIEQLSINASLQPASIATNTMATKQANIGCPRTTRSTTDKLE